MIEQNPGVAAIILFLIVGVCHLLIIRLTLHKVLDRRAIQERISYYVRQR